MRLSLKRNGRPEESNWTVFAYGEAMPAASRGSERREVFPSRLKLPSSHDSDTWDGLKESPVQREHVREEEFIVWALIVTIIVISVTAFYLFCAKAHGTL